MNNNKMEEGVFKKIRRVKKFDSFSFTIRCKTTRQSLKCFNLIFLNMGYLGKLDINKYENSVSVEKLPFKYHANKFINLIKNKKLRFEEIILIKVTKEKRTEVLKNE